MSQYGPGGITDLVSGNGGKAEITDDTQMTLFTAEGLLRAETRGRLKGICHGPSVIYFAYQRWLHTQGYPKKDDLDWIYDGWLIEVKGLHEQRAPGNSCLSALSESRRGTVSEPINNSKGCGGVMRVAPIGLYLKKEQAFELAVNCAALTHGHPSGYLSAGVLAYMIAAIIEGLDLENAVKGSLVELGKYEGHEECSEIVKRAVKLTESTEPVEAIAELGEGWVGEEALAIAVYCSLKFKDNFKEAVTAAVNHDGDSDSTGAITGNILGAYLGVDGISKDWIEKVELAEVIKQLADDLLVRYRDESEWWERYPGY
ncbi:ADP-ribosylation/Crystallin J1 [Dethiobacter alkaliphilus AHT 1]|uniref:ADP-ribosylation/Crystallin J1 n=1 Tax=Dethiobacter alkaliphilus AHT 1 TaxID=555088 RepID=C0GKT4_DETAL|nr:ADP-ribosylation/Crystallin J1 [Dethiobacter alkaliphilus AHT 1]